MAIFKDISAFTVKQPTGSEVIQVSPTEAVTLDSIASLKSGEKGFISNFIYNLANGGQLGVWAGSENLLPPDRDDSVIYLTVE